MESFEEIRAQLTGPGGPFEVALEPVRGERLPVFASRMRSLRELLESSARHGELEYVVCGERRLRYDEHLRLVPSVAAALRERYGVGAGDRVAILADNGPEWILAFWATVSLGGIAAALNGWWSAEEIRTAVAHCEPRVLVTDRRRLARLAEAAGPGGDAPGIPVVEIESGFAELEGFAPGAALPGQAISEDDPAVILYTSGTTGRPRGAVSSHRGILGFVQTNLANGLERRLLDPDAAAAGTGPYAAQSVTLSAAPLFHLSGLYGLAVMLLATGGKVVLRPGRFDPEDVLATLERERVTAWSALGSAGPRVLAHPKFASYDLSSVRNVGFGGAPVSPALQRRVREAFPNAEHSLAMGYGSSESVAVMACTSGAEYEAHPEACGRPPVTVELQVRDPEGRRVSDGCPGEIHARSAYRMLGYWRDPEATAQALRPGGWLATGDIGRIRDGLLVIDSRARDLILRSAENVHPVEIEYRLEAHPAVREAAVIGVDHPELGQEVKAVVVPEDGAEPDPAELAAFCGESLAAYKVPSLWEVRREPLPRNAAGKVMKRCLT